MKTAFVYTTETTSENYTAQVCSYFHGTAMERCADRVVVFDASDAPMELSEFHDELLAYTNAAPTECPPVYFMTDDFQFIERVMAELCARNVTAAFMLTPHQNAQLHSRA